MILARKSPLPAAQSEWAFFLDIDGTLVELLASHGEVRIDETLLRLIARLHHACDGALALVSGRSLADLEGLLGNLRIPMAGQHGLERRDSNGRSHVHAMPMVLMRSLHEHLNSLVERHPGLLLEDKGLSLALHYRQAPQLAAWVHRYLAALVAMADGLELQKGKRVLEIKPAGFDKGNAICEFMAEPPFQGRRPAFIGDDVTDEHGFRQVNQMGGLTVKVGAGRTAALHRIASPDAVRAWLIGAIGSRGKC